MAIDRLPEIADDALVYAYIHYPTYHRYLCGYFPKVQITNPPGTSTVQEYYAYGLQPSWYNYPANGSTSAEMLSGTVYYYTPSVTAQNILPPDTHVAKYGYRNRSVFNSLYCGVYSSSEASALTDVSASFLGAGTAGATLTTVDHKLVSGYKDTPETATTPETAKEGYRNNAYWWHNATTIPYSDMSGPIWRVKNGNGTQFSYFDLSGCEFCFHMANSYASSSYKLIYQFKTDFLRGSNPEDYIPVSGWRLICSYSRTGDNGTSAYQFNQDFLYSGTGGVDLNHLNSVTELRPLAGLLGPSKTLLTGELLSIYKDKITSTSAFPSPSELPSPMPASVFNGIKIKNCQITMNGTTTTYKNTPVGLATFFDYEDSSYYLRERVGLLAKDSSGGSLRITNTPTASEKTQMMPSYRFNYEYNPSDDETASASYSNVVMYAGKRIIPPNAKIDIGVNAQPAKMTDADIQAIGGGEDGLFSRYNIVENRDYVAVNEGTGGAQDYKVRVNSVSALSVQEWPMMYATSNFQIDDDNKTISFITDLDLITDSEPNLHPEKLFYGGSLYAIKKTTEPNEVVQKAVVANIKDTHASNSPLKTFTPTAWKNQNGYVQYCTKDSGGTAPNGSIKHVVKNLNCIKELKVLEYRDSENTQSGEMAYQAFWHSVETVDNEEHDIFEQIKIGRIDIKTLNTSTIYGIYVDNATGTSTRLQASVDSDNYSTLWAKDDNGRQLEEIIVQGASISNNAFNCIYARQLFETMVGKSAYEAAGNQTILHNFFANAVKKEITGYMFSYGSSGVFSNINTKKYSSAKPAKTIIEQEYGEERIEYTIADEVSYECELYGRISDDEYTKLVAMIGEEAASKVKMTLGEGAKSMWYLYLDKTSNEVDNSIKIKILDAKATDEFGENWDDINIQNITEMLRRGNGEYGSPTDSDMIGTVMPTIFNNFEKNYYRIKVRFSLYVEGDSIFLDDDGYRVVLGYAAMDAGGGSLTIFDPMANSDTAITSVLPYPKNYDETISIDTSTEQATFLKRNCHYFISTNEDTKWRRDIEKEEYGNVYIPLSQNDTTINGRPLYEMVFSCVVSGDDTTVSEWSENKTETPTYVNKFRIWDIDDYEDRSSSHVDPSTILDNKIYYVESENEHLGIEISGQSGKYVNFTRRHGCYVIPKKNEDFFFKMDTGEYIDFWADVQFRMTTASQTQGLYVSVGENPDPASGEVYSFNGNTSDNVCKIYDIPIVLGDNWCQMYYKGSNNLTPGKYTIVFGSINGTPVDITDNITPIQISYDNMYGRIEGDVDNRRLRVFIQKASEEGKSSDIPNMYYELEEHPLIPSGRVYILKESYYEVNGGFDIGFKDFEVPAFNTKLKTIPGALSEMAPIKDPVTQEERARDFYIVNRYKNFGVQPYYTLSDNTRKISDDQGDSIELTSVLTDWGISCEHNGVEVWNTDNKYMRSVLDTAAFMKIVCDDYGEDIGTMKFGETGYQLNFRGRPNFGMTITVGGIQRKVFFHDYKEGEKQMEGSITPIRCLTPIYVTYKKDIISIDDNVVLVNNTDNTGGYYDSFTVSVFDLGQNWDILATEAERSYDATFSDVGEYDSAVYAKLSYDWRTNDEAIDTIRAIDAPKLTILVRTKYDERVTRVLDGYKLEYPYGLNDILFSPNEWLTADNINLRFEKIMEDLRYLKYQTKFYLKPPTTYGGYYGDYETVLDGVRQRQYGYVPNGDLEIYRKTNENDSIDDENTVLKNCNDMCTDGENNLYACVGSDVIISNTAKYGAELGRVIPYKINEFIKNIDRIEYSTNTDLLYMLCRKTNKLYIFNSYKFSRRKQAMNISYYGEIGGYGGLLSHNKFNNPTDMCISTTDDGVDDIWVCDTGNKAVKRFSIKGQWISTIDLNEIEYNIIGICSDFKNQIHVLTQKFVFTFSREGVLQNVFKLEDEIKIPLMIRPQYQSGFLYILYEHWVAKYSYDGKYVARFAENDNLTYRAIYANNNFDVYISTEKNILRYNDSLVLRELAVTENADKLLWTPEEYRLNKNENVQDAVINTAFQRIYDNIIMYAKCIFGKIVELDSDNENERISDLDQSEYQKILDAIHKERIFVGINELVTVDVLNRSFKQMYDLLELILESI